MSVQLSVRDLQVEFRTRQGTIRAVNKVSLELHDSETLAIVGESGSGKSVSMMSLLGLIPQPPGRVVGGEAWFEKRDLLKLKERELRGIRGRKIAFVFQDPMTALNPVMKVGAQLEEMLVAHMDMTNAAAKSRALELLDLVGIPNAAERYDSYPHEFSGGMRQRVIIAMGISCNPQVLIADEATTALDVTIQAQIIRLVKELGERLGMSVIWITHDLGVVATIADRVAVMYGGRIVEEATADKLYSGALHPYTMGLIRSIPRVDKDPVVRLSQISGSPPNMLNPPAGCAFHPRCPLAQEVCSTSVPTLDRVDDQQKVACWVNGPVSTPENDFSKPSASAEYSKGDA